ncbi:MAG TPA: AMP-binding protein [Stellaceae bacterium]|nr:AMP-binding protein [Stellaceae bacterium]
MSEKTPRPKSRTLGDLLDETAATRPKAEAVVFQGERLDYAGLKSRADAFAQALIAIGIGRGDRVALLVSNRPEWLVAAFAAAKLGAVTAAISTFSSPRELAFMLDHSGAKALVMLDAFRRRDFLGAVRAERARLPGLRTIVKLDGRPAAGFVTLPEFLEPGRSVEPEALAAAQRAVRPEDIAFILYTSGSTAAPKGVQLAHGPLIANGFDIGERMHLSASDRVWLAVPLFWSFGSANALPAIMTHGGTIVLQEGFEAGEAIALIEREHCSVYYGVGNMARALAEHPEHPGRRLGAMRTGLTIGPPEDIALTIAALGAEELCNVYGATETYGNCAVADALDPLPLRLSTQGLPLPGMTIRAVDPLTRQPLPAGEVGELAVKGHVTPGYFRAPELDAGAFDNGGWFLTGDFGLVGTDGRVRFRGRLKEMIKTGGANVSPLEVEEVLRQYPGIADAYVVGVPDRAKGEIVAAAVELRAGAAAEEGQILAFCRKRLARYKVPVRLQFRAAGEFPRTPTGKINKPRLREELTGS